jgi:NitT/TauT family transport system ATP-binding protein
MNRHDTRRLEIEGSDVDVRQGPGTERESNLVLDSVTLIYEDAKGGGVLALEEIDIDVRENEFLVVVGPSGCGKTTLLKLMVGLLRPSAGDILHRGSPVVDTLQDVGMVYQDPLLLPWRSVLDNILLPVEILRLDRKTYLPIAEEIIDTVGLTGFADKKPRQLSGGMQQRVALCRALITDPSLLLMDEPFAALDALTRDEMARELARLWEQRRKTVVFVTHSISEAVLLGDRVIVMSPRPGRIERDIRIDLPRPRADGAKVGQAFEDYVEDIRETIFSFKQS